MTIDTSQCAPATGRESLIDRVHRLEQNVRYRDGYWICIQETEQGGVEFEVRHRREDASTGQVGTGCGGWRRLHERMTDSDVLRAFFGAFVAYEEHEVREYFRWRPARGDAFRPIFSPHGDARRLWEATSVLDYQKGATE